MYDYFPVSRISKSSRIRLIGGFIMPRKLTGFQIFFHKIIAFVECKKLLLIQCQDLFC